MFGSLRSHSVSLVPVPFNRYCRSVTQQWLVSVLLKRHSLTSKIASPNKLFQLRALTYKVDVYHCLISYMYILKSHELSFLQVSLSFLKFSVKRRSISNNQVLSNVWYQHPIRASASNRLANVLSSTTWSRNLKGTNTSNPTSWLHASTCSFFFQPRSEILESVRH